MNRNRRGRKRASNVTNNIPNPKQPKDDELKQWIRKQLHDFKIKKCLVNLNRNSINTTKIIKENHLNKTKSNEKGLSQQTKHSCELQSQTQQQSIYPVRNTNVLLRKTPTETANELLEKNNSNPIPSNDKKHVNSISNVPIFANSTNKSIPTTCIVKSPSQRILQHMKNTSLRNNIQSQMNDKIKNKKPIYEINNSPTAKQRKNSIYNFTPTDLVSDNNIPIEDIIENMQKKKLIVLKRGRNINVNKKTKNNNVPFWGDKNKRKPATRLNHIIKNKIVKVKPINNIKEVNKNSEKTKTDMKNLSNEVIDVISLSESDVEGNNDDNIDSDNNENNDNNSVIDVSTDLPILPENNCSNGNNFNKLLEANPIINPRNTIYHSTPLRFKKPIHVYSGRLIPNRTPKRPDIQTSRLIEDGKSPWRTSTFLLGSNISNLSRSNISIRNINNSNNNTTNSSFNNNSNIENQNPNKSIMSKNSTNSNAIKHSFIIDDKSNRRPLQPLQKKRNVQIFNLAESVKNSTLLKNQTNNNRRDININSYNKDNYFGFDEDFGSDESDEISSNIKTLAIDKKNDSNIKVKKIALKRPVRTIRKKAVNFTSPLKNPQTNQADIRKVFERIVNLPKKVLYDESSDDDDDDEVETVKVVNSNTDNIHIFDDLPRFNPRLIKHDYGTKKRNLSNIFSDDDMEAGSSNKPVKKRIKRPVQDTKHDKELNEFYDSFNALCDEVDKYELVIEKT